MRVVVIGGGLSGLASAFRIEEVAKRRGIPLQLTLLEAGASLGGKIQSHQKDGFVVEAGPNGWLDSKPGTVKLVHDLGLDDQVVAADENSKLRFLYLKGGLQALPASAGSFFRSSLLPFSAKLRIMTEPFRSKGPADETLSDFGRRRLGRVAVERLLDPMVKGIFAGDVEALSVSAAFPAVKKLEQEYGSLVRGMMAKGKARKAEAKALAKRESLEGAASSGQPEASRGGATGPGGHLHSMVGGLSQLIDGLAAKIEGELRCDACVTRLTRLETGWRVETEAESFEAEVVVIATPAPAAAALLAPLDQSLAAPLLETPYASVAVVATAFPRGAIGHELKGFGFLVPSRENRKILGSLWTSSIYPGHRAPAGYDLMRTLVGGARAPELVSLDDKAMLELVKAELEHTMGLRWVPPTHMEIIRWPAAIPQYIVGHLARVEALQSEIAARHPGLILTGNHLHGVGMNDCTADAERVAERFEAIFGAKKAA